MDMDIAAVFSKMPGGYDLYEAVEAALLGRFPEVEIEVRKTQISFRERYIFGTASLPIRKIKSAPERYIIVSFGLSHRVVDPRIFEAVEAYPNRWTHHVLVSDAEQVDGQLMDWLAEAREFALTK